jgi:hypothetical protein
MMRAGLKCMAHGRIQFLVCAVLGAATTVLVAWACVWRLPEQVRLSTIRPPDFEWLERNRESPETPYGQSVSRYFGVRTDLFDSLRGKYSRIFARRHRAGFPFACLDGGAWEVIALNPVNPWGETERVVPISAWLLRNGAH